MDLSQNNSLNEIAWEIKVPIFKNDLILKQLGLAIGIPFGILLVVLFIIKAYNGVLLICATFVLAFILIAIIFRGTYDVKYILNEKGIFCLSQKAQGKRVRALSITTFLLGLLSSNQTTTGTGMISYESTRVMIPWKRIRKIKYLDPKKRIMVYGGFAENIALFCTDDNYHEASQFLRNKEDESLFSL